MPRLYASVAAALLLTLSGCAEMLKAVPATSPLKPARLSPDSVVLELCSLRLTETRALAADSLWPQVDEQIFEPELRRKLAENGFRAGVVGPHLPAELQQILDATTPADAATSDSGQGGDALTEKPRHKHFRSGQRHEFMTSDVQDRLTLMLREDGQLRGKTFPKGQGLLAVKAYPRGDGCVRVELTPEFHFGDEKQQYRSDGETILMQPGRRRESLDQFYMDVNLSPGQVLLVASRPEMPGSAGQRFFSEQTPSGPMLRIVMIRVAQTQHDDLFGEMPHEGKE